MKFKIGDWVYVFQEYWDNDNKWTKVFKDNPGQIKYINEYGEYAIEFESPHKDFHNCEGHCKDGHGTWIWGEEYLTYAYTLEDKIAFIKELL